MIIKKNNNVNIISLIAQTATYVSLPTIHPDSHQGRNVLSHVACVCVFACDIISPHWSPCFASLHWCWWVSHRHLWMCCSVDCVWRVEIYILKKMFDRILGDFCSNKIWNHYLHRAVWPLLMADKVVGSEHHLTDVTVKTCFMPVLTEKKTNHIILQGP